MTNTRNHKPYVAHRPSPRNDAVTLRPIRRVFAALRRAHDDVTYLNKRLFEWPE